MFIRISQNRNKEGARTMTRKSDLLFKCLFLVCLILFSMFSLAGCGSHPTADNSVPESTVPDVPKVTNPDRTDLKKDRSETETAAEPEYDQNYPRTEIGFTYNDLYEGTVNPKGTIRLLVIPVEIDGGDPIDDKFLASVKKRIEGPYSSMYCLDDSTISMLRTGISIWYATSCRHITLV